MPPVRVELTLANYLLHTGYKSAVLPLNYRGINLERGRGIEPLALAWKAKVLPLYEPRKKLAPQGGIEPPTP